MLAGAPGLARAQQLPNLSGTWVLQVDKSDFGPMPPITSRTDVIDHKEPSLTIKRTVVTGAGETTSTLVYGVDGKSYKNTAGGAEITSTLKWDGAVLVMESTLSTPNGDISIVDRYSLSEDGTTLTQARTLGAAGQTASQTMVLKKS